MAKKIQQFYVVKLESARLKESNYNIKNLSINDARLNGELISISNSEMVRTIFRLTNHEFFQYKLDDLLYERIKLKRKPNNKDNRKSISALSKEIDELLFIPEVVSVVFNDRRHFTKILERNGFLLNGRRFIPFLASAGMVRRDIGLFIDADLQPKIDLIFNNNRNRDVEIAPAKFLAYYSLYSSSTIPISFPKIAVVPDLIIKTLRKVDYSTYQGVNIDPVVTEREIELECNAFDGEGLCSPQFAKTIQKDLELNYLPSVIGIRAPFIKGMLCVFDFHILAKENNITTLTDIYGNSVLIKDVDCIVTESQFKISNAYASTQEYIKACEENHLGFGVTKVNPKKEKDHAKTSYQFLQVLNLDDNQIERLCKPTIDWLKDVSGGELSKTLLYMLGETDFSKEWFKRLDITTQALLLENKLQNDTYILKYLDRSLSKKKNDARMGRLLFNGNYQVGISDPYALATHALGLGLKPLLNEFQHYSQYWNKRNKTQIACIRSPIVHSSEVNVLNLQNNEEVNKWYKYLQSGVVFPAYGISLDMAILGGADVDLDIFCTLDSPEIIQGRIPSLPVIYDVKKATKVKLDSNYEDKIYEAQFRQIKTNKIGFYTNLSSTFYALLSNFEEGTPEHNAILQRLKYGRVLQGNAIDSAKGILVDPFPEHFSKWKKITDEMSDEEKIQQEFYNRIVAEKRPLFMRWLYSHYNKRYLKELAIYNNISRTKWRLSFEQLLECPNRNEEQESLVDRYYHRSYFIRAHSTMNRISKYIEKQIESIKLQRKENQKFDTQVLLSKSFRKPSKVNIDKIRLLWKEWKSLNRNLRENGFDDNEERFMSYELIDEFINNKAYSTTTSNAEELSDMIIYCCYELFGVQARSFVWKCFGKEVLDVIKSKYKEKFVRVPMLNEKGSQEYLWSRYGTYLLNFEDM